MRAATHLTLSFEITTILSELRGFFLNRSVQAFLVGGYIRDSLLDIETRDVDVVVMGDPVPLAGELARTFNGSFVLLNQSHQSFSSGKYARRVARVVIVFNAGLKWVVDVAGLETTIDDDLGQRDFTIDAMALAVNDWLVPNWKERILDPFGGRKDLAEKRVRAVSPLVFDDDPVRLLRGVRLAAKLDFDIESCTAQTIADKAQLLSSTAAERIRDELLAIISLDGAKRHLEKLDELGLLCGIIPEFGITKGVEQPREHYWDVYGHSLNAVEGVERVTSGVKEDLVCPAVLWDAEMEKRFSEDVSDGHTRRTLLKLGALLHDIAKPQTKKIDANGRTRFLGHHTMGASMSEEILHGLRLSNRGIKMVGGMVESHLRPTQMSQAGEMPTPRAVYRYFRDLGDVAIDTLYLSLADHLAARGPELDMDGWRRHVQIIAHILEVGTQEQGPVKMTRVITGHDLVNELSLTPGPVIGVLLEGLQEAQAAGEVHSRDSALEWARCKLPNLELAAIRSDRPEG